MADCACDSASGLQRRTLRWVLGINAAMFVLELGWGLRAQSTGLIADSLDMLADACVYGVALLAVGRGQRRQRRAAALSGLLQIGLALLVLADVLRRFLQGSEPVGTLMVTIGLLALAANLVCLALVFRHRGDGVHMRASLIFSSNDTIANAGVIVSGLLVALLGSRLPDLLIGLAIGLLVLRGGLQILQDVRQEGRRGR